MTRKRTFFNRIFARYPTLDEVLAGDTVTPYTLHDLRNYLFYQEHSLENLEFLNWYDNYVQRYDKRYEQMLVYHVEVNPSNLPNSILTLEPVEGIHDLSFNSNYSEDSSLGSLDSPNYYGLDLCGDKVIFGTELNEIQKIFLEPNAPLELNLPYSIKKGVLLSKCMQAHPDRLAPVANNCYQLLQHSFQKFLKYAKVNKCRCNTFRRWLPTIILYLLSIALLIPLIVLNLIPWFRLFIFPLIFVANLLPFIVVRGLCPIQLVHCLQDQGKSCSVTTLSQPQPMKQIDSKIPSSPISQWGKDPFYRYLISGPKLKASAKPCSLMNREKSNEYHTHLPGLNCIVRFRFFVYAFILTCLVLGIILFIPSLKGWDLSWIV